MSQPTVGALFRLFLPLGIGMLLVSAEMSIANAALARLPDPALALAIFSVATSLSFWTESPIVSILQVSTAMADSPAAVAALRRYAWIAGFILTGLAWGAAATPVYDLFVEQVMGIPPDLADAARLPFAIMASTPLIIGNRRVHQGVLIRRGESRPFATGTAIRIVFLCIALTGIVLSQPAIGGVELVGLALLADLAVEAFYIRWLAGRALRIQPHAGRPVGSVTLTTLWHLHAPIGMAALLFNGAKPLTSTALAHATNPTDALATWAVIWSAVTLIQFPLTMVQQVVIAQGSEPGARPALQRFTLILGLGATGLIALIGLTPLYAVLIGTVLGLPAALLPLGQPALLIAGLTPLAMAWIAYYQGREVIERRPGDVRLGTIANLGTLALALAVASLSPGDDHVGRVAVATAVSYGAEAVTHVIRARQWQRQVRPVGT